MFPVFILVLFERVPIGIEPRKRATRPAPLFTNGTRMIWRKKLAWVRVGVTTTMIEAMIASMAMMMTRCQWWA